MKPEVPIADLRPVAVAAAWTWLVVRLLARLSLTFLVALVVFALVPLLFGMTGSDVFGGSMRPHIQAGDVVLSLPLSKTAPTPMGRVVTFEGSASGKSSSLIIHRIVGTNKKDGTLITAGDANLGVDTTPLRRADIIGRAYVLIPWVGLPLLWLSTGEWWAFSIWILVTLLVLAVEAIGGSDPKRPSSRAPPQRERPLGVREIPRIAVGAAMVAAMMVAIVALGPANAVFTSQTSSVGNNWAYPAATQATKLAFVANPSDGTGGVALVVQPTVRLLDAAGKATTGTALPITLSLTTPAGATLTCAANPVTTSSGVSTFSGCTVDKAGTYTMAATSPSLTAAVSTSFTIAVGPATHLIFSASPSTTPINTNFATQPVVTVVDAGGNKTGSAVSVRLSLTTAAGATLSCTANPKTTAAGVVTFAGCRINQTGTYTLTAASSGLVSAVSPAFVIGQYTTCANAASADGGNAYFQYHLDETSNSTSVVNSAGFTGFLTPGTYRGTMTSSTTGPFACPRDSARAYVLDGSTSWVSTPQQYSNPRTFSIEVWFKTTVAGGKLIGFGDTRTVVSNDDDRHLYIGASGRLNFGTYNGAAQVLSSSVAVNDGTWHHAAGTMSPGTGMKLYLDGVLIAANASWVTPQDIDGYWHIGYDKLAGWPDEPSNYYFTGQMRFVAAYGIVLSATQVQNHWAAGQ